MCGFVHAFDVIKLVVLTVTRDIVTVPLPRWLVSSLPQEALRLDACRLLVWKHAVAQYIHHATIEALLQKETVGL